MRNKPLLIPIMLSAFCYTANAGSVEISETGGDEITIQNKYLARNFKIEKGILKTVSIENKRAGTKAIPLSGCEFSLKISEGTEKNGTDLTLTSDDFTCEGFEKYNLSADGQGVAFKLQNKENGLKVSMHVEIKPNEFYLRKYLKITSDKTVALERIDIENIAFEDAFQPYKLKCIYTKGKWSPGLGQPLYTKKSGTFWGVEFPASYNFVKDKTLNCGYLWGRKIKPGETYTSYKGVVGVSDDPEFNQDAFFEYINNIRIRPLKLQMQYNSWFDFGRRVDKKKFTDTVKTLHKKLVVERGCKPLKAYVIDDGWQDCGKTADWSDKTWKTNTKFDQEFATSFKVTKDADSTLGLWMSPGCNFGAKSMVPRYREKGFEAMENYMSLAGPQYMGQLEERMVNLTKMGVTYFKLDGLFGHLDTRDFELNGEKYGLPSMPQLLPDGIKSDDKALNDSKYDELKTYYLVAGTERLIKIFTEMSKANPDVYIVISNGAYLSPWWLMHIDSSWMIMAGDAAGGADRTGELKYRDGVYYEVWEEENTQFPMNAIFNHEPKKVKSGESKEVFRKYLYMNMSRGTGFIELYLKTPKLQEYDWDVLAESLQWAYHIFPTFTTSRMHGGDPRENETYGYTSWNTDQGYISFHNPSDKKRKYTVKLDRKFGLVPKSGPFFLSSPIDGSVRDLKNQYTFGDTINLELEPKEIRILNFDKTEQDWSYLKKLQNRTPYTPVEIESKTKKRKKK